MPLYEYYCSDCDVKFEKLVSLTRANEQPPCPGCHGGNTRKLLSTFAAVRKSGNGDAAAAYATSSSGGCSCCSGGNCSTCH